MFDRKDDDMGGRTGRKPRNPRKTVAEQLEELNAKITEKEVSLKEMKAQRKELEDLLKKEQIDKLLETITNSGITIEEATNFIEDLATTHTTE